MTQGRIEKKTNMKGLALLLLVAESCQGFAPVVPQQVRRKTNRLTSLNTPEDGWKETTSENNLIDPLVEESDSIITDGIISQTVEAFLETQIVEAEAGVPSTEELVDEMWSAKTEMEEAQSMEMLVGGLIEEPTTPDDEEGNAEAILAASAEAVLAAEITENLTFENNTNTALSTTDKLDVEAILAASEVAVVTAEATLSEAPESSFGMNGTDGAVIAEDLPAIVKAADVVGEPEPKAVAPTVSKIVKFAIPAVGVWLSSPLLSLIDTSAVGIFAGTAQQAALNPAVAVTDYAALLIAFLYTAATNLVATAQETDRTVPGKPNATKAMIGAMQLSTYVGAGLGFVLLMFTRQLLRGIIGNDAVSPELFSAAMKYVRIRALGMPAAAILGSAQASCLGMQDIRSPLYVLAAAAVVNLFGDLVFVGSKHPLFGGAAGAAWATVFSQYTAVFMFVRWLTFKKAKKSEVVDLTSAILEITGKPDSKGRERRDAFKQSLLNNKNSTLNFKLSLPKFLKGKKSTKPDDSFSVKGLVADQFGMRSLLKLPPEDISKQFLPYVAPVTATQVGRVSGYIAMSHVVSSSLGTVSMAAQQVIVSLFYCLTPIADSLSLTAQSFLPAIFDKKVSKERANVFGQTVRNFFKAGGVFGAFMCAAIGIIPFISGFFTSDPAVVAMVNSVSPLLLMFFAVHGVLCAAEGMLLGSKDLSFLGKMYSSFFVALPLIMLRVKRAALAGVEGVNLASVWKVFVGYQLFRCVAWIARVLMIQRRSHKEANAIQDAM